MTQPYDLIEREWRYTALVDLTEIQNFTAWFDQQILDLELGDGCIKLKAKLFQEGTYIASSRVTLKITIRDWQLAERFDDWWDEQQQAGKALVEA